MGIYNPPSLASLNYQYPGGILRPAQQRFQDRVSLLDFGADPTGVEDSTPAMVKAATAAAAIKGFVFLWVPPGIFNITSAAIPLYGELVIVGSGESSVLLGTLANSAILDITLQRNGVNGLLIDGLLFDAIVGLAGIIPWRVTG